MAEARGPRPELVLLLATILWGAGFIVVKLIVREAPPLAYLTLRFALAALVTAPFLRRLDRQLVVDGLVIGLLNGGGLLLQTFGQAYTTASKSAFITSLNTPFTPLAALVLYRVWPRPAQLGAVLLATLGVALLTYPAGGGRWNSGDLVTIGCAALYAVGIVEVARRSPRHAALPFTAAQLAAFAVLFAVTWGLVHLVVAQVPLAALPEMLRLETRPLEPSARLVGLLVYMALMGSVVTFLLQTWALGRMNATHAAVVYALEPVFATLFAVGLEGSAEWPGARGASGAAVVLLALGVAEIRPRAAA